jgi:hypothetical protein
MIAAIAGARSAASRIGGRSSKIGRLRRGWDDPFEAEQQREAVAVERSVDSAAGRHERIAAAEPCDLPGARVANAARPAGGIAGTALRKTPVPITPRCLLLQKEIRPKYLILHHPALRYRRH